MRKFGSKVTLLVAGVVAGALLMAEAAGAQAPSRWIDAGVTTQGATYLFQGAFYLRFRNAQLDPGYPRALAGGGWKGLPADFQAGLDAALYAADRDKTYFFKGNQYLRLTGVVVDPGYPRPLPGGWHGLPAEFQSGIDAALYSGGRVFFFKSGRYVRFTGNQLDPGYPTDLPGGWELPPDFSQLDAAVSVGDKNFFFSGRRYVRLTGTRADPGYPLPLPGGWSGLAAPLGHSSSSLIADPGDPAGPEDGGGIESTIPGSPPIDPVEVTTPPGTGVEIPGPETKPGPGELRVRDEFVAVQDGRLRLGYVGNQGNLVFSDEQEVPGFLYYAGNFDNEPGDELLAYDPPTGKYFLFRFDSNGRASPPELVRDAEAFAPEVFRTVGRFADAQNACLFGWIEGRAFGLKQLVDNVCFSALTDSLIEGVAVPVDVTGDGRDEAVFVDIEGTIDVVVLGGPSPTDRYESDPRLEFTAQRAAERWADGLELTHADLDDSGGEELLAVVRASGEVWRLTFDEAGRVTDRSVAAAGLPADWVLLQAFDANGDGREELLVKDRASGQFRQASWNPGKRQLELTILEGVSASVVYPGRFLGDGSDSLLLQKVWPDKGCQLGLVGFNSAGQIDRKIEDDRLVVPELAVIVVGDFIFGN